MANSLHAQIRDAIKAAQAALADGNVKAGRGWPMAKQNDELIKVYLDQSNPTQFSLDGQPQDMNTRVRCEYHARGTDLVTGEDRADALMVAGFAAVMADASLGGLCMHLQPIAMGWSTDEEERSIGVAQVVFQAFHRTPFDSIEA